MNDNSSLADRLSKLEDDWETRGAQLDRLDKILDRFPSADDMQSFGDAITRLHDLARLGKITGKGVFWAATIIGLWESARQFFAGWWSVVVAHKSGGN
jgi:hypothetical protein